MKEVETKQTALMNKPIYLILRTLGKDTGVAKASGWGSSRAEHRESGGAGNMNEHPQGQTVQQDAHEENSSVDGREH